jgi:hypothetical protein
MLRGWKSASCSGFLGVSGATGGAVIEVVGILPVTSSIPIPSSHRLRSTPFIDPPNSVTRFAAHYHFSFDFFYIVYFCLSKWDKKLRVQISLEANTDFDDATCPQANRTDQGTYRWPIGKWEYRLVPSLGQVSL